MHHTLASLRDAVGVIDAVPVVRLRRPPANGCDHFVVEIGTFSCSPKDPSWHCPRGRRNMTPLAGRELNLESETECTITHVIVAV